MAQLGLVLKEFGPDAKAHAIAFTDDPYVIRRVARAMAAEYRACLPSTDSPRRGIEEARLRCLEEIVVSADVPEEAEGEPIARPVWWDTLSNSEEVSQSQ